MIKKLYIFGMEYAVRVKEIPESGDEYTYGDIDHVTRTITLNEKNDEVHNRETLIHEALHAIATRLNINLSESDIQGIAAGLTDMITANNIQITMLDQA